jgi:hypothetical protein
VRCALEGSMIEAEFWHAWTDHFDALLEDVFDLQRLVEIGPQTLIEWRWWFEVYRHARDRTLL